MKRKKFSSLKRLIEIEAIVTAVALFLFLGFSLVSWQVGLGNFTSGKHQAASPASLFSQKIYGPPAKPVITLTPSCQQTGARIAIDWGEDEDATSFDIYRNGSVLVTGLVTTQYNDDNVDDSTTYLYYVTANGPMGNETSDIGSATTDACGGSASEQINVVTFDGQNVQNPNAEYDTTNRRPQTTGTTTIENALVDIQLFGPSTSFALTNANGTGYWHWTPVSNLSYGDYTMYLTATDPADSSIVASRIFFFEIKREEEENDDEDEEEDEDEETGPAQIVTTDVGTSGQAEVPGPKQQPQQQAEKPVDFSIVVANEGGKVSSGEYLDLRLVVLDVARDYQNRKANLNISIVDPLERELDRESFDLMLYGGQRLEKRILIPCPEKAGEYTIRAEITIDDQRVSQEETVEVSKGNDCAKQATGLETSLIATSSGVCAFTDWLGWMVIALLLLLLILVLVFMILTRRDREKNSPSGKPATS